MIAAEALEAVGVRVYAGDKAGAAQARTRFLRQQLHSVGESYNQWASWPIAEVTAVSWPYTVYAGAPMYLSRLYVHANSSDSSPYSRQICEHDGRRAGPIESSREWSLWEN